MKKNTFFYIFILLLFLAASPETKASSEAVSPLYSSLPQELFLSAGDQKETVSGEEIKKWISIDPSLKINLGEKSEIENINYCPTSRIFCRIILGVKKPFSFKKETAASVDKEKIKNSLDALAEKINKDPVDAKFKLEGDQLATFVDSQEGIKLDVEKSVDIVYNSLLENSPQDTREITLAWEKIDPKIKPGDINDLGINTLIGEGTSNFRGSPKNRVFNINVAIDRFNGVLIKPGEEFSFVGTLGPVDGEHGYAPELVIKKDKTEPEFGGGICQVSTTAFRAAIYSGLEITARRNHAYPVAYYNPQGMDATVYVPRPDLRFINNTPGYILIQTKIEGTVLTFQFFGTDDGRKTEIDGPKITEKNPDGSMKTTFTQKVYDKEGNLIINDVFNSNYDSPSKYPHPGEEKLTTKPKGWSDNEWKKYKQATGQ